MHIQRGGFLAGYTGTRASKTNSDQCMVRNEVLFGLWGMTFRQAVGACPLATSGHVLINWG